LLTAIHVRWLATVFPTVGDAHQRVRSHSRTELAASGGNFFTCTTCNPTRLNVGGLTAQPVLLSGPRSLELLTPLSRIVKIDSSQPALMNATFHQRNSRF
jgi:hypothetical protein